MPKEVTVMDPKETPAPARPRRSQEPATRRMPDLDLDEGGLREGELLHDADMPAFERLHALVRKGYIPNIGAESSTDVIQLRHLGKAPDLVLHADGAIEPLEGRLPRHKKRIQTPAPIAAERDADHLKFMKFLETVPPPSLRDRTRPFRKKYLYVPAVLIAIWAICFMFTVIVVNGM